MLTKSSGEKQVKQQKRKELKKMRNRKQEEKRKKRVRSSIKGVGKRPRLTVFRSNTHIYAQIIDDNKGITIISFNDVGMKLGTKDKSLTGVQMAEKVGEEIGKRALKKGIAQVVFDRGEYKYHGRVKSLADGARKGGLKF